MRLINPLEILEIETTDINEIKKAKRKKLTEFDLSDDGTIEINNIKIHKSEFNQALELLEDEKNLSFLFELKNDKALNNFLSRGDEWFFTSFQKRKIYDNKDFLKFISPYFAVQYDRMLLKAYKNKNKSFLKKLHEVPILVTPDFEDKAFNSLYKELNDISQELHKIRLDLENEESAFQNPGEVWNYVKSIVDYEIINLLPNYYQGIRTKIAQKVRNLSVAVFNTMNSSEIALELIEYALKFNVDALNQKKFQEDYQQISDIHKEQKEQAKYAFELIRYGAILVRFKRVLDEIEYKYDKDNLIKEINDAIDINELNQYPDIFDNLRNQFAALLRSLSVEVFNNYRDHDTAVWLIRMAQKICVTDKLLSLRIQQVSNDLDKVIEDQKEQVKEVISLLDNFIFQIKFYGIHRINQHKIKIQIEEIIDKLDIVSKLKDEKLLQNLINKIFEVADLLDSNYKNSIHFELDKKAINNKILANCVEQYKKFKQEKQEKQEKEKKEEAKSTSRLKLISFAQESARKQEEERKRNEEEERKRNEEEERKRKEEEERKRKEEEERKRKEEEERINKENAELLAIIVILKKIHDDIRFLTFGETINQDKLQEVLNKIFEIGYSRNKFDEIAKYQNQNLIYDLVDILLSILSFMKHEYRVSILTNLKVLENINYSIKNLIQTKVKEFEQKERERKEEEERKRNQFWGCVWIIIAIIIIIILNSKK